VPVRITAADTYDLIGEVVGAGAMVAEARGHLEPSGV